MVESTATAKPRGRPAKPTIDAAFTLMCDALEGLVGDDLVTQSSIAAARTLYPTNTPAAWGSMVTVLEGVLGTPIRTS